MPLNRITHKLGTRWRQSCSMVWMAGAALAWCVCGQARAAETRCSYVKPDRKSTRLNSSHSQISYAVFCLKKKIQQLNALETLVILMLANNYAFLQITRRRFLNEWEAFTKVLRRRYIRRRITIPLTLSNLKLLRRITRTAHILHSNFTRRQVAIQKDRKSVV